MSRPLQELIQNSANFKDGTITAFPDDLGSETRSHYIYFSVNEIQTPSYDAIISNPNVQQVDGLTRNNSTITGGNITSSGVTPVITNVPGFNPLGIRIKPSTTIAKDHMLLYMPDTLTAEYTNAYQEDDLSDYTLVYYGKAAGALFDGQGRLGGQAVRHPLNTVTSNPGVLALVRKFSSDLLPVDALLKAQGLAINPQVQLLFKATALRTFQFNFLLTPKNQTEAESIGEIIYKFKYYSAPEIGGGAINNDLFFKMPDTFNIEFRNSTGVNKQLHKIDECVLERVDVDYAASGAGWAAIGPEGYPLQTRLTLSFKELNIIDKKKIQDGKY